jgi:hypothetical protein
VQFAGELEAEIWSCLPEEEEKHTRLDRKATESKSQKQEVLEGLGFMGLGFRGARILGV